MRMLTLTPTHFTAGVWEGELTCTGGQADVPRISVTHLGRSLPDVTLTPATGPAPLTGRWLLRIAIPAETLSEGVQTYVIRTEDPDAPVLGQFCIAAGEMLEEDLRSEVAQLRAEVDMLKQIMRRSIRPHQHG